MDFPNTVVTVPQTGHTIRIWLMPSKQGSRTVLIPDRAFDGSDPSDSATMTTLLAAVKNGSIQLPDHPAAAARIATAAEKLAVVAVPGGETEQPTEVPEGDPGLPQLVSRQEFEQVVQQLQQQLAAMQQAGGGAVAPAPTPAAGMPAPAPAPAPMPAPAPAGPQGGLLS